MLRLVAPDRLTPGSHEITVSFAYDGGGKGRGGTASLLVDGHQAASGHLRRTFGGLMSNDGGAAVGRDYGTTLTEDYRAPFIYPGDIRKVTIDLLD